MLDDTAYDRNFRYYLQPNEIEHYKALFIRHLGKVPFHRPAYWLNRYFLDLHQNTYRQVYAIIRNNDTFSDNDILKLIEDIERKNIKGTEYEYLGIENAIRRKSFLRDLKTLRARNVY